MAIEFGEVKRPEPPVEDGDRVCYLLLQLGCPPLQPGTANKHLSLARRAAKHLFIRLWSVDLRAGGHGMANPRYFFRFPWYKRDDSRAIHLAEAFLYTASTICPPFMDTNEEAVALRIPKELVKDQETVSLDALVQLETSRDWSDRVTINATSTIAATTRFAEGHIEGFWRLTPYVCANAMLFDAVRFLAASRQNFYVYPGQIEDVVYNPTEAANTAHEQIALEAALLNAFKAIEAVIGDPPRDDRKLAVKLRDIGLEFHEEIGYGNKDSLGQWIRRMNIERDKKAAHGSTSPRTIRIVDLMEYQACARHIVIAALEHKGSESQSR